MKTKTMNKPTPTDAATPRLHLMPRDETYFPSFTIGGNCYSKRDMVIINRIADELCVEGGTKDHWRIAALIVRAVNLLEAHEAVAEAAKAECRERDKSYERPKDKSRWTRLEKALDQLAKLKEMEK
jgi:hypothetical protein